MRDNGNVLQQAVSELVGEVPIDTTSHLSADDLAAYHEGRLTSDEDSRLGDHLMACAECTSLLLDLVRLQADDLDADDCVLDPNDSVSEFELAAAWRGLAPRLEAEERSAKPPSGEEIQLQNPIRSRRFSPAVSLLAASLVAAVVGLSTWVHTLRRTLGDLERVHLNAPVVDLFAGVQRGADPSFEDPSLESDTVLELAPGEQFFNLILSPPWEKGQDEYTIEVLPPDGKPAWSETGLRRNKLRTLSLILPRRLLTVGRHRIRLFYPEAAGGEPVAEFWLRVEPAPRG